MKKDPMSHNEMRQLKTFLEAAASGNFFPDWEFQTLIGATREEVSIIVNRLDQQGLNLKTDVPIAISTIGNLLGYPHGRDADLRNIDENYSVVLTQLLAKLHNLEREVG